MSTTLTDIRRRHDRTHTAGRRRRWSPAPTHDATPPSASAAEPIAPVRRHERGGRVLFTVPFQSAMTDPDVDRLAHALDLWSHMNVKLYRSPTSRGVARLDHFSGLFLEPGDRDGKWVLEARTWGQPAPETVHGWHLVASVAAHQLDPTVPHPARQVQTDTASLDRPVEKHHRWSLAHRRGGRS